MWRQVQACGLATEYASHDGRVRKLLKRPQVLEFIPEAEVRDKFFELKDALTAHADKTFYGELTRWYQFFEIWYIGKWVTTTTGRGAREKTSVA